MPDPAQNPQTIANAASGRIVPLAINVGIGAVSAGESFVIPMARTRRGSRVTETGVICRYRATTTGDIDTLDIWLRAANPSATSIIFNLEINGVAVFAGGARPTIATGASHVQKTSVGAAVVIGDLVEITVEQCPAVGIGVPIETLARVVVS